MQIEQVLTNLLDNATKHSPEGSPIRALTRAGKPGEAEIAV